MTAHRFELDPRLAADCSVVTDWPLCRLLLMNDARYPWFILVPRKPGLRELYELDEAGQRGCLQESVLLGRSLMQAFKGEKLNVAALGNVVAQLHIHHIVRRRDDDAWPAPVWGRHPPLPCSEAIKTERLELLRAQLPTAYRF